MDESDNALGAFLRARRERTDPSDHGIRDAGRRRVPGLRREELAFLVGVSAPYYARLEQGRDRSPSPAVLDAIAAVLRLDADELAHVRRLAAPAAVRRRRPRPVRSSVPAIVQRLIDDWPQHAAVVVGRYRDVLAANALAVALNPGFAPGSNLVRSTFLDDDTRQLYPEWREVALGSVAGLRASAGDDPDDPALAELVGELSVKSEEFRTMWARHDVRAKTSGMKRYRHPLVGDLDLDYQTFDVNGTDQIVHVFSAVPGTPAAAALQRLASITPAAPQPDPRTAPPQQVRRRT